MWTANPQQFVEDEDDDTFSYSVRISAQDLLLVREQQKKVSLLSRSATIHKIPGLVQYFGVTVQYIFDTKKMFMPF